MSDYEGHKGKLRQVLPRENETFKEMCKRISFENGAREDSYYEGWFDELYEKYIRDVEVLYEVFDHVKFDPSDSYCNISENEDGTKSFQTIFYNGGTGMGEMVIDKIRKDRLRETETIIEVGMDSVEAYVTRDGKKVETFNLLAEDYAYTLAQKEASKLKAKLEKEGYAKVTLK